MQSSRAPQSENPGGGAQARENPPAPAVECFTARQSLDEPCPVPGDIIGPRLLTPGGLWLIAGPPKVGKSDFLLSLFTHAAAGLDFLRFTVNRPLRIFYAQAELERPYLQERYRRVIGENGELFAAGLDNLVMTSRFHFPLDEAGVNVIAAAVNDAFGGAGWLVAGEQGMIMALGMALVMNFFAWWFSDTMLLGMYGAKQVTSGGIYNIVFELARDAKLPMLRVYIIETAQPNAFATGRGPSNAAVAVTRGLIELLDARELRGVIAHELAHIKNRDTLIMTITATIAGALGMLANFAMFFGVRRDQPGGPLGTIAVMILAPIAAMLVQFAISRTREYSADRIGAEICNDPQALASALEKIEYAAHHADNYVAEQNPATAHLFIINPLHMRQVDNLFSTHPSTKNRVQTLREMASGMGYARPRSPWERVA